MNWQAFNDSLKALRQSYVNRRNDRVVHYFQQDPDRFGRFSRQFGSLTYDFSKHAINVENFSLLLDLAKAAEIENIRNAMFNGERVNVTEHRAAMHMALRDLSGKAWYVDGQLVSEEVAKVRSELFDFADKVRSGEIRGLHGKPFTDIVNIGIGGSDLGPAMATHALAPYHQPGLKSHFVANVDGADLGDTLRELNPETTLFIVVSKTFATQETMTNAASARRWLVASLGEKAVAKHFCAVSTQADKVAHFGIALDRTFGFWDWVGGRYSLWSAVGLSVIIAVGSKHFKEFLTGAQDVDQHFLNAPLADNIPVLMALIGIWQRNICGHATQAVIAYDQRLNRFAAYLQQLEMESNGKSVDRSGKAVMMDTVPVIWGEPGTNGQHAFFQMLHQGTQIVPIDFLVAAQPTHADFHHHQLLVANCLAQSEALMRGKSLAVVKAELAKPGKSFEEIEQLAPHKVFPGNRPSSTFLYNQLDPYRLGTLIALYEHKVFVQSIIWNINAFDQWGVELGKELATRLASIIADPKADASRLDGSTGGLVQQIRQLRHKM